MDHGLRKKQNNLPNESKVEEENNEIDSGKDKEEKRESKVEQGSVHDLKSK
jgi:hypothetical protein